MTRAAELFVFGVCGALTTLACALAQDEPSGAAAPVVTVVLGLLAAAHLAAWLSRRDGWWAAGRLLASVAGVFVLGVVGLGLYVAGCEGWLGPPACT